MCSNWFLIWQTPAADWGHGQLRISAFKLDVVRRASIESHDDDTLWGLETGGTDTSQLDDDLPEMMVSLIEH